MPIHYSVPFNLKDCMQALGLEEKGRVQQAVDSAFLRGVKPFTPFAEGRLYDSATQKSEVGSGEIIFDADDKARRLYYHPEYNFQQKGESESGGLGRGGYWAERYIQNGGLEELQNEAKGAMKK